MKILVIEDSSLQINWAKNCFKKHELVIAESQEEYLKLDLKIFDLIISDLFLPVKKGEQPTPEVGMMIAQQITDLSLKGDIKAKWSIVSDLDGHISQEDREQCMKIQEWRDNFFAKIQYKFTDLFWENGRLIRGGFSKGKYSFIVNGLVNYCMHLEKDGKIMKRFGSDGAEKTFKSPIVGLVCEHGMKMLKPYDIILIYAFKSKEEITEHMDSMRL